MAEGIISLKLCVQRSFKPKEVTNSAQQMNMNVIKSNRFPITSGKNFRIKLND